MTLDAENPSIYESSYIGYDKNEGVLFDSIGTYTLRGVYYALDGSRVLSNVLTMRVTPPLTDEDEKVAELLLGDDQGMLFYLLGSDSNFLQQGNDALNQVLEEHGEHPLAVYARMVKGFNASREFKMLTTNYQVDIPRSPTRRGNSTPVCRYRRFSQEPGRRQHHPQYGHAPIGADTGQSGRRKSRTRNHQSHRRHLSQKGLKAPRRAVDQKPAESTADRTIAAPANQP